MKTTVSKFSSVSLISLSSVTRYYGSVVPLASDDDNIAIISGRREDRFIRETLENFDIKTV